MSKSKNEVCPKCNKPTMAVRRYKNGEAMFIHEQKLVNGEYQIYEECYVEIKDEE